MEFPAHPDTVNSSTRTDGFGGKIMKVTDLRHLLVKSERKSHACIASSVMSQATFVFILLSWRQRPSSGNAGDTPRQWPDAPVNLDVYETKSNHLQVEGAPALRISCFLLKLANFIRGRKQDGWGGRQTESTCTFKKS